MKRILRLLLAVLLSWSVFRLPAGPVRVQAKEDYNIYPMACNAYEVDVLTAKAAGVPCLSVLWGFRDREEIEAAGGQQFCDDTARLVEKLEEMINGK